MNIREELHKALVDNVPQVGGRVYPLTLPQDTNHAALVYRFIGNHDTTGITCTIPINTRYGVQVDCFSANYGESAEIMELVKQVLRDTFLAFNIMSFEDYLNITLKYRQIIDAQLEQRPVFGIVIAPPIGTLPPHIINGTNDIYNGVNLVIN